MPDVLSTGVITLTRAEVGLLTVHSDDDRPKIHQPRSGYAPSEDQSKPGTRVAIHESDHGFVLAAPTQADFDQPQPPLMRAIHAMNTNPPYMRPRWVYEVVIKGFLNGRGCVYVAPVHLGGLEFFWSGTEPKQVPPGGFDQLRAQLNKDNT